MSLFAAVTVGALIGTPHCLGMCGALAVAGSDGPTSAVAYHAGRIGVYAVLGALLGAVGGLWSGPPWVVCGVGLLLLAAFCAVLAGLVPEPRIPVSWGLVRWGARLARRSGPVARLGFGAVNGLLPCGLLYGTLAMVATSGGALLGAGLMLWFGLLTAVPLVAATYGLRSVLRSLAARRALAGVLFASGAASLVWQGAWG